MSLSQGITALPTTPPSPEAISQDSAFPIFPNAKSRGTTPTTPSDSTRPPVSDVRIDQTQNDQFGVFAPLSPRRLGGDDVMNRLKALSPGPFDTAKSRDLRGHKKTSTASSIEDFIRSPNQYSARSSGNTGHSKNDSQSSAASSLVRKGSAERRHHPTTSTDLAVQGRSGSADSYRIGPLESSAKQSQPMPSLGQIGRSQTSPPLESGKSGDFGSIAERTQAKPSKHRPTPSLAAAIRPLDEIGSMSSFKPSRSLRSRKPPATTETPEPMPTSQPESRADQRYQDTPPVPKPSCALGFGIGNPYHFSTESNSSNDSAGSDIHTASSRSSPPLNESPQRMKKADTSRLDKLMGEFQLDLENSSTSREEPAPGPTRRANPPPSFSRPLYNRPTEPAPRDQDPDRDPIRAPAQPPPPSRHSPQEESRWRPSNKGDLAPPPSLQRSPPPSPSQPAPLSSRPAHKPRPSNNNTTTTNKGTCRGCSLPISGKSVSSADGRLTGRYHKGCFVCQTCKSPFQTSDFYVLQNQPYCARHYHVLNGSLCRACDRGIEGQYLETEAREKFHARCFSCQDCGRVLREEYFEVGGRAYCEAHAFRGGGGGAGFLGTGNDEQGRRAGGSGRRYPERRTTRLMMM